MRQRLGLAEILMKDAEIAILDEPTSGLDPQATHRISRPDPRSSKRDGVTVLLSSHLLDRVQSVCDRVALFQAGPHRADGHGRRARPPGARRRLHRRGRGRRRRLAEQLSPCPGVTSVEQPRPRPLPPDCRPRRARRMRRAPWSRPTARCGGSRSTSRASRRSTPATSSARTSARECAMRREGSPFQGVGTVVLVKELRITSHQRAHAGAGIAGGADRAGGALRRDRQICATPRRKIRSCSCGCSPSHATAAVVRRHPRLPGAADGDRARLRSRQRRTQPAHAVAHPGAADLSRRAAVREIPRRPCHAVDQPARAVAAGDRARPDLASACRRAARRSRARWCSW